MIRIAILSILLVLPASSPAFADSSRALRDIAFTSIAVRRNRTAHARRAVLDNAFDAASLALRDAPRNTPVRGKNGSRRRKNWFAQAGMPSPRPRRPYAMPALLMPGRDRSVLARMGSSFQTALAPWKRLLSAASQSRWSRVAVVSPTTSF